MKLNSIKQFSYFQTVRVSEIFCTNSPFTEKSKRREDVFIWQVNEFSGRLTLFTWLYCLYVSRPSVILFISSLLAVYFESISLLVSSYSRYSFLAYIILVFFVFINITGFITFILLYIYFTMFFILIIIIIINFSS